VVAFARLAAVSTPSLLLRLPQVRLQLGAMTTRKARPLKHDRSRHRKALRR
jgi:hypothetical protein